MWCCRGGKLHLDNDYTSPSQCVLYIGGAAGLFPPRMPAPTPYFPWLQFLHAVTLKTELHTSTYPYRLRLENLRHHVVDNFTWSRPVDKLKSFTGGEGLMQCSKVKLLMSYLSAKEQLLITPVLIGTMFCTWCGMSSHFRKNMPAL